jgi:hypothetical protein
MKMKRAYSRHARQRRAAVFRPRFVVFLPRPVQRAIWKRWPFYNHVVDSSLLTVGGLRHRFPDAEIRRETVLGPTKSIMAVQAVWHDDATT